MRNLHSRGALAAAFLVVLACALGAYWYLSNGDEESPGERHGAQAAPGLPQGKHLPQGKPWATLRKNVSPQADDDPALSSTFAILRGRPEQMPRRLQDKLTATLGAPADELELHDAQHVRTATEDAWIVYGRGVVCIVQAPDGNVGCDPVKMARKHGAFLGLGNLEGGDATKAPSDFLIMGLAPDWAKRVRVRVGEDRIRTIPIRNNVFSLRAPELMVVKRLER